jgi:phospholipid/cholesterol/gamma-HCH transport system substrate-binding protein
VKVSKEFKVGILALASLAILYLGVNFLRGIDFFSSSNRYYVIYDDIDGLTVSNPVLLNGLSVGRVNEIKILQERGNQLLVELDIEKELKLGKSSKAVLINSDLLGSKAVLLEVGEVVRPLEDGDTLISAVDEGLSAMVREKSVPIADNLVSVTQKLDVFLEQLNKEEGGLNQTLSELSAATKQLRFAIQENRSSLRHTMDNFSQMSATLNDEETGLKPLLTKFNTVADSLNAVDMGRTVANLNEAVNNLNAVMENINRGEGTMGQLATNDSLYNSLNASAESLDALLEDLRENPKRYVHFSIFGRKDKPSKQEKEEKKAKSQEQVLK